MNDLCGISEDKLPFQLLGLCLQEPMALILDWVMAFICFFVFLRLKNHTSDFHRYWKLFFLFFGLSTFFGGLGHLFFYYTGNYGKIPSWTFAIISNYYVGKAMLKLNVLSIQKIQLLSKILSVKFLVFMSLMLFVVLMYGKNSFVFSMVDSVLTTLAYCLGLGIYYKKQGLESFKYIVWAVVLLFPSIFIFVFKINVSLWLNKDDLSHLFMIASLVFFYIGVKNTVSKVNIFST
ncbi:MAG: hypothetical protein H3C31_05245 [Brumimicrobium sp.]|nr:hypothetical protein [Brumimicrobium sp.]